MTTRAPQPPADYPASRYGERSELEGQQGAAPLAGQPVPVDVNAPPVRAVERPDMWGPTQRPGEPVTSGIPVGPGDADQLLPNDGLTMLRAIYQRFPNDDVRRLLEKAARKMMMGE